MSKFTIGAFVFSLLPILLIRYMFGYFPAFALLWILLLIISFIVLFNEKKILKEKFHIINVFVVGCWGILRLSVFISILSVMALLSGGGFYYASP